MGFCGNFALVYELSATVFWHKHCKYSEKSFANIMFRMYVCNQSERLCLKDERTNKKKKYTRIGGHTGNKTCIDTFRTQHQVETIPLDEKRISMKITVRSPHPQLFCTFVL